MPRWAYRHRVDDLEDLHSVPAEKEKQFLRGLESGGGRGAGGLWILAVQLFCRVVYAGRVEGKGTRFAFHL
jgi:hypothetical protein